MPSVFFSSRSAKMKVAFWMALPPSPGRSQTAQRLAAPASLESGSRSGAYGMPSVAPCGILPLSRTDSLTLTTVPLSGASRSLAEAMFRTGCNCFLPSVSNTTYRVVDLLAMMTCSLGASHFWGATGLNMPQAPKTARTTTAMMAPGSTARSGLGAPSSEPVGLGCRNCAINLRFAKV